MKSVLRKRLMLFSLLLALLAIPMMALAQSLLSETFTSTDGTFSLNYPAGWLVEEYQGLGVVVGNNQAALDALNTNEIQPGNLSIVIVPSVMNAPEVPPGITPTSTPLEIATLLSQAMMADMTAGTGAITLPPAALTLNGKAAARAEFSSTAENMQVMMLVVETGKDKTVTLAVTALNQMAQFEPMVLAIAGSMTSSGAPTVPLPTPITQAGGGTLTYGSSIEGNLTNPAGDRWTFTGSAGDTIRIRLTGSLDTYLELYDASGALLTSDDDSAGNFNSLIDGFSLPQTGQYTIVARAYGNETGAYTLTLEQIVLREPGPIAYDEQVQATMRKPAGDRWTFTGKAGEAVAIRVTAAFDNKLELYDSAGTLLTSDDDSGGNYNAYISGFVLPADGQYLIVVSSYSETVGAYTLELSRAEIVMRGVLSFGDIVAASVTNALGDRWTFSGQAGEATTIVMVGGFDTYLELYDANGTLLTSADYGYGSSDAVIDSFALPATGEYTIVARGYYGETGDYYLILGHKRDLLAQ